MFFDMFLRIFSDCCIFFALLGCCPSLLPYSYPLLAAALIYGASAALASFLYDKGKKMLSRVCVILPFLSLLLAGNAHEMLILAMPMLYTAFVIFQGQMYLEYFSYRKFFIRSLIILGAIWAAMSIGVYIEDPKGIYEKVIFTEVILQYTLVHFLCGIVLQRQLRLGAQTRAKGEAGQLLGMAGSVGVMAAGFFLTESVVRNGVLDFVRSIVSVLTMPFQVLLGFLVYLMENVKQMKNSKEYQEAWENSEYEYVGGYTDYQEMMSELLEEAPEQGHSPWIMVLAALAAVVVLALMVIAFVKILSPRSGPMIVSEVRGGDKKKSKVSRLSNRGKVRYAYREFLHYERQNGFLLKPHYTTADILRKVATPANETPATQLREVYLRARYDEEREVTREQVDAARDALKSIRSVK